ncbi:2-pyrone-4,6-dicarboxylate hydrolase [Nitrosomonas sp. JL21]|uniref:amidohydrolase family protein n=1 Tax=Nitrosomonas sp. JL21 TaxID=153949 RepID=UPI0013718D2A|nr:amidohydrolase family protein [Nitrosomonas sp. JL21]MBL8496817.1 amidohydrolase family protein [Nitrosomonas sp.]MBL8498431.1 amidohydrolase family protein [Nitrosomonas sp.]MCC7092250.1 amidohydrolase family protein [Nitrosomonas sp.]MXS77591.1 2-pyrone-4,6-dicarboxylate hydrolase [Nitrosomonas sp. JL21]
MSLKNFRLFDAHLHIIDDRFPLISNNNYLPPSFTCEDYLNRMEAYYLAGGAVVSGSFQALDQTYLIDALKQLGPSFVGITQISASVSDEEILELNCAGVRAVRFNLKRGGSEEIKYLDSLARRIHELAGWHTELYVDSRELDELYPVLIALPAICIDHLGLSKTGFATLLKLVENGAHVKATGFGRVDFKVESALKDLFSANPDALMFGTDLPSTRALRPYEDNDLLLIIETLGAENADKVLFTNAVNFYRPEKIS